MLGMIKERKARSALESVAPVLADGVRALPPVQRCATMAVAHGMLWAAADDWGQDVLARPVALERSAAAQMVCQLADAHARIITLLSSMEGRGMSDPGFAGALRQARATEVAMATLGAALDPRARRASAEAWKAMWSVRRLASDAVRELRAYEDAYGTPSVPPFGGRTRLGDRALLKLAATLPPMFRRRKRSTAGGKKVGDRT